MPTKYQTNKYERGTNALLDVILDDEEVWIVNGPVGRKPIIANTEEEAILAYKDIEKVSPSYSTLGGVK